MPQRYRWQQASGDDRKSWSTSRKKEIPVFLG